MIILPPPTCCSRHLPGAMSSFKGSGGISTARRVLRVSRTRESFDGSLHPPLDSQGTARSSGNYSQAVSRVHTTDLEAPLLEQRSTEAAVAAELATAAHAAEADARATIVAAGAASGEPNGEAEEGDADAPPSSRPSLTGPGYTKHRDSRQLWRSARNNLGAMSGGAGGGRVGSVWSQQCRWRLGGTADRGQQEQRVQPHLLWLRGGRLLAPQRRGPAADRIWVCRCCRAVMPVPHTRAPSRLQACRIARTAMRVGRTWFARGWVPCRRLPPWSARARTAALRP